MPNDQNTEETQNQANQNIDWTRKGFGWVPDYPDIRDFFPFPSTDHNKPGPQEEIQKEGVTDAIDGLVTDLVEAIRLLLPQSDSQDGNFDRLRETLAKLESRTHGGVRFNTVKVYRVLSKDTTSKKPDDKEQQDDREQQQEILQLKKRLYFLIQEKFLTKDEFIEDRVDGNKFKKLFETPAGEINWLTSPEFDESTESLVKQFQAKQFQNLNLRVDGIVGLNTFLTLEKCLTNLEEYKKQDECNQPDAEDPAKIKNPAKLVTIACLVPDQVFGELIDHLYQEWLKLHKQLSEAFPISSDDLITLLKAIEKSEKSAGRKAEIIPNQLEGKLRQENIQVTRSQLIELCKSEFLIIDPIVSVILMMNAPLANQSSITKFVSRGMEKFEELLGSLERSSENEDNLLALAAVLKAEETLDVERSELIGDIKNSVQKISKNKADQCKEEYSDLFNNFYPILVFYSLIENVILNWKKKISSTSQGKKKFSREKQEEFSKKEHFELSQTGETASPQSTFFVRPEIVLPVSSSSIRLKKDECNQKAPYFVLPGAVDLSYWCSPVEDQGTLNTCTACAGVSLLEYFAKRSFGEFEDLSPLFLYKAARDLRLRFGDVGAPLRDIMRAMILFGVAPERYWPYRPGNLDAEPPALCYSYAQNYQTLKYFRLDRADLSARNLLLKVKAVLSAGFPCMFGFTAYTSIYNEENIKGGYIPFPNRKRDRVVGGHAVVAVGYNDYQRMPSSDGTESLGALLVRNSWGREWGMGGYGWLPYDYILKGLTGDWWSLLKAEWFGQGYFGLEASDPGGPPPVGASSVPTTRG